MVVVSLGRAVVRVMTGSRSRAAPAAALHEALCSGSRTRGSYSPVSPGVLLAVVVRVRPVFGAVVASIVAPRASVAIVVPRARRADQSVAGTLPREAAGGSDRRPEMDGYRYVPRASLAARRSRVYWVAADVVGRCTSASSSRWSIAGSAPRSPSIFARGN